MAIRERKGRASPFQVYWNNPFTGKRESANFATKQEALKHDSLIKHRLKFDRESFRPDDDEEENAEQELTLEQAYLLYLKQKQFSKDNLSRQLCAMHTALELLGEYNLSAITSRELTQLYDKMAASGIKEVTINYRMKKMFTVLRWAAHEGFCDQIMFPQLSGAKYEKFIPPSPEEISNILAAAAPHIQRVIIIGSQCGVRIGKSELFQLTWSDVDLEQKILRVHGAKKNLDAPWREVPIRTNLVSIFDTWRKEDMDKGIKYLIHHEGKPVQSIKTAWRKTLLRAGIKRRIRPYDLRHAFATELIAAGADIGTIAKLMGHATPTMLLQHYQYVMDRQKRRAVEGLPDVAYVSKNMCPKKQGLRH